MVLAKPFYERSIDYRFQGYILPLSRYFIPTSYFFGTNRHDFFDKYANVLSFSILHPNNFAIQP
jgi:hypothetical protein